MVSEDNHCTSMFVCSYPINSPFWSISESRSGLIIVSPSQIEFRPKFLGVPGGFLRVVKLNAKALEISGDIWRLASNIVEVVWDVTA